MKALVIAIAVLMSTAAFGKPVSEYMQRTSLIYLREVESLKPACAADTECLQAWETNLSDMEDLITVRNNNTKHSKGDDTLFDLLKVTRFAGEALALSDGAPVWRDAYIPCYASAHTGALLGDIRDGAEIECNNHIKRATEAQ
jgi:hypothetical protein